VGSKESHAILNDDDNWFKFQKGSNLNRVSFNGFSYI
jgi:hypothetical protein